MSTHVSGPGPLPPCRHIRINLGDPAIVKHTLDEQAAMFVLDQGYVEDVTLSNLKLGFGLFAVVLTAVAQFYPVPFPASAPFLKACVLVYFAVQGLLQLLHLLVEKDCILLTKKKEATAAAAGEAQTGGETKTAAAQQQQTPVGNAKKRGGKATPAVAAASSSAASSSSSSSAVGALSLPPFAVSLQASLLRHHSEYQLTLATRTSESVLASLRGSSSASNEGTVSVGSGIPLVAVSVSLQVTDYFDVNGTFLMERYQASMRELMQAFAEEIERVQQGESKKVQ